MSSGEEEDYDRLIESNRWKIVKCINIDDFEHQLREQAFFTIDDFDEIRANPRRRGRAGKILHYLQ